MGGLEFGSGWAMRRVVGSRWDRECLISGSISVNSFAVLQQGVMILAVYCVFDFYTKLFPSVRILFDFGQRVGS